MWCTGVIEDFKWTKHREYSVVRARFVAFDECAKQLYEMKEKYGTPFYAMIRGSIENYSVADYKRKKKYDIFKKRYPKLALQVYKVHDIGKIYTALSDRELNNIVLTMEDNVYDIYDSND